SIIPCSTIGSSVSPSRMEMPFTYMLRNRRGLPPGTKMPMILDVSTAVATTSSRTRVPDPESTESYAERLHRIPGRLSRSAGFVAGPPAVPTGDAGVRSPGFGDAERHRAVGQFFQAVQVAKCHANAQVVVREHIE